MALRGKEMTPLGAVGPKTNIDRRNCERQVPMKVLCLGVGRTGTSSMRAALLQLGFDDCYHMLSITDENSKDADMWIEAFEAKFEGKGKPYDREDWDRLLGHCMAVTYPAACFSEELIAAYPNAKVILTVRDNVEVCYRSVNETLWTGKPVLGVHTSLGQSIFQAIIPKPVEYKAPGMVYKHTFLNNPPEEGRKGYLEHNEMVMRLAKENGREFLEFNVKEGWGPLCQFLGVEEPEMPFPRVNDTKTWREFVAKTKKAAAARMLGNLGKVVASVGMVGLGIWMATKT